MSKNLLLSFFVLFFIVTSIGLVKAYDYSHEYSDEGEVINSYDITLDGQLFEIFDYNHRQVIFDVLNSKPLFDKPEDKPSMTIIFEQEYYHNKYSTIDKETFQKILASNLQLDLSWPCQAIDFDRILLDKTITTSENYVVKKYIPKRCIEYPLNCKEIADTIKKSANYLANVGNYATPQVILAIYCKGESKFVIPTIIAPAKQLDAIIQNIQERSYLIGQIETLKTANAELNSQLAYGARNTLDFLRDGYFAAKETQDYLTRTGVRMENSMKKSTSKVAGWIGINVTFEMTQEPKLWSEKLSIAKNEASNYFSEEDVLNSKTYSDNVYQNSITRLQNKRQRNLDIESKIVLNFGNLWLDWYKDYLYLLAYDYNISYLDSVRLADKSINQAIILNSEYKYNSAFTEYNKSLTYINEAKNNQVISKANKQLNIIKILILIILGIGVYSIIKKYKSNNNYKLN